MLASGVLPPPPPPPPSFLLINSPNMTARNPALRARNSRRPKPRATIRFALGATSAQAAVSLAEHRTIAENAPPCVPASAPASTSAPENVDAQQPTAIAGGTSPEVARDRARAPLPHQEGGLAGAAPSAAPTPSRPVVAPPNSAPAGLPPRAPTAVPGPARVPPAAATGRTLTVYNW